MPTAGTRAIWERCAGLPGSVKESARGCTCEDLGAEFSSEPEGLSTDVSKNYLGRGSSGDKAVGYLFGPTKAIEIVVCAILLSALSVWSYIQGNETARDADEYREQLISIVDLNERVIPSIGRVLPDRARPRG